ncbi:MAG: hypothetical protein KBE23_06560 [Chloroflexi bacterium]|nr:hypothetical protein [Chloroflexota bacterium]MBP7042387.1 hypothetical protein [Chloroflexota bacterium]
MSIGAPTAHSCEPTYRPGETAVNDVPADGWVAVRQAGKLLFEYHPERELVRVVQRKRPFVADLKGVKCERLSLS